MGTVFAFCHGSARLGVVPQNNLNLLNNIEQMSPFCSGSVGPERPLNVACTRDAAESSLAFDDPRAHAPSEECDRSGVLARSEDTHGSLSGSQFQG